MVLRKIVLLLFFVMPVLFASAQSNVAVRSYKKISSDTVCVKEVAIKSEINVEKCSSATAQKSAAVVKSAKVDSLSYVAPTYRLGERVIMPGDSGRDVRSVAKILVNKIYIDESELIYTADGGVLYKGELVRAVKHFQEFNGFHVDGIIGHELIKALRKRK